MSQRDERIMAFVEAEIGKQPGVSTTELYEKAKALDTSVSKMSVRQFHARFPLQVKRRRRKAEGAAPRRKARTGATRSAARGKKPGTRGRTRTKAAATTSAVEATKGRTKGSTAAAGRKPASSRKRPAAGTRVKRGRPSLAPGNEAVREVFLRFAEDLTGAEGRSDLVKVLAGVDRYVAQAVKASGK